MKRDVDETVLTMPISVLKCKYTPTLTHICLYVRLYLLVLVYLFAVFSVFMCLDQH